MENAVDALKIAAAILVFVIALSISFSLFNKAKSTADTIVTMRDKQGYLTSAAADGGVLYTSSNTIEHGVEDGSINDVRIKFGVTTRGDRVVNVDDVVATLTRYNKEKYGVTIVRASGDVIARFDSNTENIMRNWYNITSVTAKDEYVDMLNRNTDTIYAHPQFDIGALERIYEISVAGQPAINCGAPWYGNDIEIRNRISAELAGPSETYSYNGQSFSKTDSLLETLSNATTITEVINEIDQSTYLKDTDALGNEFDTNLLQQYEMPTIEVIYILQ